MKIFKILLLVLVLSIGANAATFLVNDVNDVQDATAGDGICATAGAVCTLRAAITEANALAGADIITVPAGTYTITLAEASDNANANGDFDITSDITINGAGSGSTIVQAAATSGTAIGRVFHIRAAVAATTIVATLDGMTIRNGRYANNTFGAGIRIDQSTNSNITLSNLIIRDNLNASSGGGISISGATTPTLSISNSTITANNAGSAVAGTGANGAGLQVNTTANVNISNSTISNNTSNNAIAASTVSAFGGGIIFSGPGGTNNITNSTISGNSVTISGAGATGSAFAAGIYNQQTNLTISNSTISNNTVSNTVTPNNAFHAGIRILASTTAITTNITNSTISGNQAGGTEGGGVINFATSTANSTVNITGSTVSGNRAPNGLGGGLENFASAAITGLAVMNVTNSTISGNTSLNTAGGFNSGATATTNYNYATIASNTATNNIGGIFQDTTGVTNLKNSIVADNSSAGTSQDISGTITSQDYNHVENTSGGTFFARLGKSSPTFFALANDVTGTDPQLGALANNGGTTQTHLPASSSPVLNTIPNGTSDCGTTVTTSQNGVTRPTSTGCEKGATELAPTAAGSLVRGRLVTPSGRGLANALVMLTDSTTGETRSVRSSAFGYFTFEDCATGHFYIIDVPSKRYHFNQTSFTLSGDLDDLVLTAQ